MMTSFYTHVHMRGNKIYLRGYDKGLRVKEVVEYTPYLFVPKTTGKYKTLDGQPVEKMMFESISEAREFLKTYEDVSNMKIYGLNTFQYLYIFDTYKGDIDYDPKQVKIGTLDIECMAGEGFPDIQKADKPLTAITVRCRNRNYVFGLKDFFSADPNTYYIKSDTEVQMVHQFLQCWKALDLDVVTGWNIEFFDVPYLVNRIKALGMDPKKLSPWNMLDEKMVEFRGKENQSYTPVGISVLDYYQLYRKFMFGNQESYKLDYIAQIELGEKKLDYSQYDGLDDFYEKDPQKYIEYNIHDCVLVDKLDDKLKFLEQVMALAYDAKVNYNDTMTTVRPWDIIIHNYLLEQGIVIPPITRNEMDEHLLGGFVKEVRPGLSRWVVSFDLNSLYPHLIMQYNISPETFAGRIEFPSVDYMLEGTWEYRDSSVAYAANGCTYRKDKQGFLPQLMERMYDDRTKYKKLMIEAKQRFEKTKSNDDEKLIARYHNMQMAKKIQLNSAYGALGNQWFRWFNFDHAEAITTSGQLSIRWIEKKMNEYMNRICKTTEVDYVIAADTDSIYVTFEKLIPENSNELEAVKLIDQFCETKIQQYINSCYDELADMMNAYQQKMQMKRETIANKGIWKAKKMYILNAWNVEGVQYDKPKLKIQGIEAVRSSTPHVCREKIKEALTIIMNGTQDELKEFVKVFNEGFLNLPFEDVAFPRGLKGMGKYQDASSVYKKGTPIQVKGALLFNHFLKVHKVKNIAPLTDGDKIKFAYLKTPNPINDTVIATSDIIPKQFNLDKYIDRDMQFDKSFMEPLRAITEVINWDIDNKANLEEFFG